MLVRLLWGFLLLFLVGARAAPAQQPANANGPRGENASAQQPPANASAQQPAANVALDEGKRLFLVHCAYCHGAHGEGISALISIAGPSIQAVHNPGAVLTALEVGPKQMPSFARVLTLPQMHALADYVTQELAVMPLTGGNLAEGGQVYRVYCNPCHGPTARGGVLAFVSVNPPSLADKSPAMIAGAIRLGPGPMPSFPASVISDQQVASIVQYVEFMKHPPNLGGSPLGYFGPVAEGFIAWMMLFVIIGITAWIEKGGKG